MADYTEGLGNAIREGFCTIAPAAAVGALIFAGVATLGVADVVAGVAAGAVGLHAYNRYCNQPLPDEGRPSPPFSGGQCPVDYNVTYAFESSSNFSSSSPTYSPGTDVRNFIRGPITGIRVDISPTRNTARIFIQHNGTETLGFGQSGSTGDQDIRNVRITGVVPSAGGDPNACGSLPPVPPVLTPGDNIVTNNITYINNEGDTVTIPVTLAFGYAQIDFNGTVTVPVKVNFDLNPELNLNGDINLNTGDTTFYPDPSTPKGGCKDAPGDFIPDPTIPDYPDSLPGSDPESPSTPDESRTRKVLRGVVVTVDDEGRDSGFISQGGNPDVWFPDLGFVQFAVQIGDSVAWLRHEKVNSLRHLIQCDWPSGAIEVRGTPRPGVTWTLTPVYTVQTFSDRFPPE